MRARGAFVRSPGPLSTQPGPCSSAPATAPAAGCGRTFISRPGSQINLRIREQPCWRFRSVRLPADMPMSQRFSRTCNCLREYLRRQYAAQPLINQVYVLWASSEVPDLLSAEERKTLIQQIESLQQSDGGWKLASLTQWKRLDDSVEPSESDGLATALCVLALERSSGGVATPLSREASHGWSNIRKKTVSGALPHPTNSATRRVTSGVS